MMIDPVTSMALFIVAFSVSFYLIEAARTMRNKNKSAELAMRSLDNALAAAERRRKLEETFKKDE